jgi:organic radical activating enzyme
MKCKYLDHQICIRPDGQYRLCCVSGESNNKETIHTHTPQEWHDSEFHVKVREQMERDEWPEACASCRILEENGVKSQRQKTRVYGPGLSHFDLRFGNSCNLKCISCWEMSSSSIAEEADDMRSAGVIPLHNVLEISNFNWASEETFKRIDTSNIKEVYLTGGEPMMVRHLPEFLESLDKGVALRFNTNCTIWNPKIEKILRKFDQVLMALSLDAVDRRIDYIRYGSDWNQINEYAKRYADFCKVDISPTISVLNATFTNDLEEYAYKNNFGYCENILRFPDWLNCKNAPDSLKEKYQSKAVRLFAETAANPLSIEKFKDHISRLDSWRKVSIKDYLPEVALAYGIN